ncbi:hypothetical protein [Flavobacterium sp.]|uniref:hypothetical protein n=1 Tax=Flavobacterium sp. TaxID=239 RepID=UPI0025C3A317|nr:hypothetical protein [Flavobacterium sp.]MBA4154208.1 hypothetical protein [Flavobacterium sp.]
MENLDLILLTIVVIICFIAFFISTFKAFEYATKLDNPESQNEGILTRFLAYLQSIVKTDS